MSTFLIGRKFKGSFAYILHEIRENVNCPHQIFQRVVGGE